MLTIVLIIEILIIVIEWIIIIIIGLELHKIIEGIEINKNKEDYKE